MHLELFSSFLKTTDKAEPTVIRVVTKFYTYCKIDEVVIALKEPKANQRIMGGVVKHRNLRVITCDSLKFSPVIQSKNCVSRNLT